MPIPRRRHDRSRSAHDSVDSVEPVRQGDQFLLPISADPDHHQQTRFVLIEAHFEMDTVDPHVHVISVGQRPVPERCRFVLLRSGQAGDRRR